MLHSFKIWIRLVKNSPRTHHFQSLECRKSSEHWSSQRLAYTHSCSHRLVCVDRNVFLLCTFSLVSFENLSHEKLWLHYQVGAVCDSRCTHPVKTLSKFNNLYRIFRVVDFFHYRRTCHHHTPVSHWTAVVRLIRGTRYRNQYCDTEQKGKKILLETGFESPNLSNLSSES